MVTMGKQWFVVRSVKNSLRLLVNDNVQFYSSKHGLVTPQIPYRLEKLTLLREWFLWQIQSRIHRDIDRNSAVLVETWEVVGPLIPIVSKMGITLLQKVCVQIRREFPEILTETCSFSRNMGLLPLIPIVTQGQTVMDPTS